MNSTKTRFIVITSTILLAAVSRLFPHIPNFTPVAAIALFGGAYINDKRLAFVIPMVAMFLSDLMIGLHNTLPYVYAAFALTVGIGMYAKRNLKVSGILMASLVSSILFFVITNFGVWAASGFLNGFAGLTTTYVLGIPFFGPTVLSDLFYNAILFGGFYLATVRFPQLAKA